MQQYSGRDQQKKLPVCQDMTTLGQASPEAYSGIRKGCTNEQNAERQGVSQEECGSVAGCIDSGKEKRCNLRKHLIVGQGLPRLGVLRPEQQICEAAPLWPHCLDMPQQIPHDGLHEGADLSALHTVYPLG